MEMLESCDVVCGQHPIFILVDAFYENKKLALEVDGVMREIIHGILETASPLSGYYTRTVVFTPSLGVEFSFGFPASTTECVWQEVKFEGAGGIGGFFSEFNKMLSSKCLFQVTEKYLPPVIILLSTKTDSGDYKTGLSELKCNNWFNSAAKIAIDFTDGSTNTMPADFTGMVEAVLNQYSVYQLTRRLGPLMLNRCDD
jgi:hypothetical protein